MQAPWEGEQDPPRGAADRLAARDAEEPAASHGDRAARRRLIAVDVVSATAGWAVGWVIAGASTPLSAPGTGIGTIAVGVVASVVCFASAGLYRFPVSGIRSGRLSGLLRSLGTVALITVVWQASLGDVVPGLVLSCVIATLVVTTIARYGFDVWLIARRAQGHFRTAVVVAGASVGTAGLVDLLRLNPEAGFHATAVVGDGPVATDGPINALPWLGGLEHAREAVHRTGASGVLVAVNGLPSDTVNQLVFSLSSAGIPVYLSTGLLGVSGARLQALSLAHEPVALVRPPRHSAIQVLAKRALDVVLASMLLVVTAPLMAVAAVLIKAHDRGPVLFRQVRIGQGGEPFTLLKLRTMEVDAEARLADLRQRNERHGPLFKVSGDPRVTPIGGLLRAAAIDELPQLFNVLSGRMSMVGPRPALPAETAEFDDELQRRHLVRPGVTGLWQVDANHKASFDEYRRLDLFYVDNWSVAMDLAVMIDTVPVVGRRALEALRRPAPSAPAPVSSPAPVPEPAELTR
ncbi:MAG TPA: sugar transferase [Acidimicrobiales bacterium]|nr:sugar transferase [Acidimicrobiales bacterium]